MYHSSLIILKILDFIKFNNEKGWKADIGINQFVRIPPIIASYLQLPNPIEKNRKLRLYLSFS